MDLYVPYSEGIKGQKIYEDNRRKDSAIKIQSIVRGKKARQEATKAKEKDLRNNNLKSMFKDGDYSDILKNHNSENSDKMVSTVLLVLTHAFEDMEGSDNFEDFKIKVKELLDHLDTYLKNKPNTTKAEGGYKRKQKSRKKGTKKKRSRKKGTRKKGTRKKRRK